MIIPHQMLSPEALQGVIEAFVASEHERSRKLGYGLQSKLCPTHCTVLF